jgi:2-methylisocitrate lyase-like PEP mutase family enzyme
MINPQKKKDFAAALRAGQTQIAPGCYDAMSAMMAVRGGATAVMTSGFAVSATHLGFPDVELYTMTENLNVVRNIANAVDVPVIADTDTGYGNAMNVMRTVREFEQAGVCAMIFEDQTAPKRCPVVANQIEMLPALESAGKIRAAVQARRDPDTLIIARTDAATPEEAIMRAKLYAQAGADLIQPISRTFTGIGGLRQLRAAVDIPLSLQILGWLEADLTQEQIAEVAGVACYPLVGLMSAAQAMQDNYARLMADKNTANLPHPVMSMADFKTFIGFEEIEERQVKFMMMDLKN